METAAEMHQAVLAHFAEATVLIGAAAPADYTPTTTAPQKLKRAEGAKSVALQPTEDTVAECGRRKRPGQRVVAFAAETQDLLANARGKLAAKQADLIVANDVSQPGLGMEMHRNAGYLLFPDGKQHELAEMDKAAFAEEILDAVAALLGPIAGS